MVTLAQTDNQLGNLASVIAFYEALALALFALGDDPIPVGHSFFLASLTDQGKTTFKKDIDKKILKVVTTIVSGKKTKVVERHDLKMSIHRELKLLRTSFEQLVAARHHMQIQISDKKVEAIIKGAAVKKTVKGARAHVKKEAAKHGLGNHEGVLAYIE